MKSFNDYITTEGAKGGPRSGDHSPVAREVETGAEYMAAKDKSPIIVAQNPVDKKWYALGGLGFVSISKPMRDKATAIKTALKYNLIEVKAKGSEEKKSPVVRIVKVKNV